MKPNFLLLVAVLLTGCSSLYMEPGELLRTQNAANVKKLSVGMSQETVVELMGQEPAKGLFYWVDNPYRSDILTGKDGKSYNVLYYYTDLKARDDKITDDELTPLVFEGGKLIGWGYPFLDRKVPPRPVYIR